MGQKTAFEFTDSTTYGKVKMFIMCTIERNLTLWRQVLRGEGVGGRLVLLAASRGPTPIPAPILLGGWEIICNHLRWGDWPSGRARFAL